MGYIDIHSHVLFGVDDGAKNLEMSLRMIQKAYEEGIRVQYATPHFSLGKRSASKEKIMDKFGQLRRAVQEQYPDYELYLGSELYYEEGVVDALKDGRALTMNNTRYVLVEFAFGGSFEFMYRGLRDLTMARYKPILAHVERYNCLFGQWQRMYELKELGVLFQLNTENFKTNILSKQYRNAFKLINRDLVDFVATDAHDDVVRTPDMRNAMEIIVRKCGDGMTLNKIIF